MKGLLIFLFLVSAPFAKEGQNSQDTQNSNKAHQNIINMLKERLERDQQAMDQFFNDQFFKQADQMFKQLSDDKLIQGEDAFDQMIQSFRNQFQPQQAPSRWERDKRGLMYVLPFILGPRDKMDLKIKNNEINLHITRTHSGGSEREYSYQFEIPKHTDINQMETFSEKGKTIILFPWEKGHRFTSPVLPNKADKSI